MKRFLTANDVISDIEFELLQSTISRDELARAIRSVKTYQDKLRAEYFSPRAEMTSDALTARQFQVVDMLLSLLEEVATDLREARAELRQLGDLSFAGLPAEEVARGRRLLLDMWSTSELDALVDQWPPRDFREAMSAETLVPEMVLQPPRIPVIGGLLNRVRIALHKVALFYVERLAHRQAKINAVYGSWIEKLVSNAHEEREILRVLAEKVELLEK